MQDKTRYRKQFASTPCGLRRPHLCLMLATTLLACASLFAQQSASQGANAADAAEDTSKKVDESEENYRARMELRDQRYREQPRADMIYSSQAGKEKIDQLPEASRQHIKEQLRDMIIASRQWKPGEDVSDYPYEPSAAAQADAQLRSKEREAWAEQLQKYQQREAAAYANAESKDHARADGQNDGSANQGAGKAGAMGSAGPSVAAAGQNPSRSVRSPESYQDTERQSEAISTAGVSENALSFLQGKGHGAGTDEGQENELQPGETGGTSAAASPGKQTENDSAAADTGPATEAPPGSLAVDELAMLRGMNPAPGGTSDESSEAQSGASPATSGEQPASSGQHPGEPSDLQNDAAAMAGTLDIDDLDKLQGETSSATPGTPTGEAVNATAADPAEPGTLDIAELKRLQGN